ncbi:YycH family regulatory protein [Lederbergia citri]|uniref:Regulatory protein YycH domain-containing protein n=1 Tax=Lederbergia citri TaxID=2833580 RepID=A0A942TH30_9BACI|nr:two-component system activity regulator YycH [Lederbergia citri]MBS4196467.1 hypothetical protein [Lederbergia citri]
MRYETVKSIALTVLVALSIFLTWSLWTYKPKYEFPDTKYVHKISIADQKDAAQLIKPIKVLFDIDDEVFGTVYDEDINSILSQMSTWNIYNLGGARILNPEKIEELSHPDKGNRVEITFPDLVPFDLYKGILHFEGDVLPNASFDRIVIDLDGDGKGGSSVSFISTSEGREYKSNVNAERVATLLNDTRAKKNVYDEYTAMEIKGPEEKMRTIYVTAKEKQMSINQYAIEYFSPEKFKAALFRDPAKVRRDDIHSAGEKYTDDRSLMNVDFTTNMIEYINPGMETVTETPYSNSDVLKRSIDFVNEHWGWTGNYRYFNMSLYEKKTIFQLFKNNFPIFNEQGMTSILLNWGNEEIYRYKRPYFSIKVNIELPGRIEKVLPSGESVLNKLLKDPNFKPEMFESMLIGYKLSKSTELTDVIDLEPSWYYLYGGSWIRYDLDDKRGDMGGLE